MTTLALQAMRTRAARLCLVIFDCDGVLIDSEPIANRICAAAITRLGWRMTAEQSQAAFLGMNLEAMVPVIEARIGGRIPEDWPGRLERAIAEAMSREARMIPGAAAALSAAEALGLPWRVVSNSSHAEMAAKFACTGLTRVVAGRVHSYHDVPCGKPAPDLFLAAAAAEGVAPETCLVIEDSIPGVRGAIAAGMACLGYGPGGGEALAMAGAVPFTSMFELPGLLRAAAVR